MPVNRVGRVSLLAGFAVLQLGAAACSGKPTQVNGAVKSKNALDAQADSADQVLYGVRAVLTDQGETKGILVADRGYIFEDGTRIELRGVNVTFIDSLGIKQALMTAVSGTYLLPLARVEVRGKVLVVGTDGRRLQSEHLVFDLTRNIITGAGAYTRSDSVPKRQSSGVGFEFEPKLTKPKPPPIVPSAKATPSKSSPAKSPPKAKSVKPS